MTSVLLVHFISDMAGIAQPVCRVDSKPNASHLGLTAGVSHLELVVRRILLDWIRRMFPGERQIKIAINELARTNEFEGLFHFSSSAAHGSSINRVVASHCSLCQSARLHTEPQIQ